MRDLHQIRENIDIIFRMTTPEVVIGQLRDDHKLSSANRAYINDYGSERYKRNGVFSMEHLTNDEVRMRYDHMKFLASKTTDGSVKMDLFNLLRDFSSLVLVMDGEEPLCKAQYLLGWNSISSRVGQDLFVCTWMAYRSVANGNSKPYKIRFDWSAVIRTDDRKLSRILAKGLAENHFHLNGSTQNFLLTWTYLMNHPAKIKSSIKSMDLNRNLMILPHQGIEDNMLPWNERILYAAYLRALLFCRVMKYTGTGEEIFSLYKEFDLFPETNVVKRIVNNLRNEYGAVFRQLNNRKSCLDYAISGLAYDLNGDSPHRLLSGERSFLYRCMYAHYRGELREQDDMLLYLYLLIKNQMWSEMVQVNGRKGFDNFSEYQSRKDAVYYGNSEYEAEALRLSIYSPLKESEITSLEARIMPEGSAETLKNRIIGYDRKAMFHDASGDCDFLKDGKLPFFYVLHFPKIRFTHSEIKEDSASVSPRNREARKRAEIAAKAIVECRKKFPSIAYRILGIDACSNEIGCRPETFATEFRYLRDTDDRNIFGHLEYGILGDDGFELESMNATYHVGEDFLDICDGLRAVDEALMFLEMRNGDRIGHGMVLGIDAWKYYENKNNVVYLQRQDLFDNLVWIFYRSLEWDIEIGQDKREWIKNEIKRLGNTIFSGVLDESGNEIGRVMKLNDYYRSWKLRGDHPEIYKEHNVFFYSVEEKERYTIGESAYEHYMYNDGGHEDLKTLREKKEVRELIFLYHYNSDVKTRGLETEEFFIEPWYIELMEKFQEQMKQRVADRGIYIECNPSSNRYIGAFDRFDEHPMLKFNNHFIKNSEPESCLYTSINTDDLQCH